MKAPQKRGLTVWKFPLPMVDDAKVTMPVGAELLTVAAQGGQPFVWARVDPKARREPRFFRVAGTGHPDVTGDYLGTFMLHGGSLVFHVFSDP